MSEYYFFYKGMPSELFFGYYFRRPEKVTIEYKGDNGSDFLENSNLRYPDVNFTNNINVDSYFFNEKQFTIVQKITYDFSFIKGRIVPSRMVEIDVMIYILLRWIEDDDEGYLLIKIDTTRNLLTHVRINTDLFGDEKFLLLKDRILVTLDVEDGVFDDEPHVVLMLLDLDLNPISSIISPPTETPVSGFQSSNDITNIEELKTNYEKDLVIIKTYDEGYLFLDLDLNLLSLKVDPDFTLVRYPGYLVIFKDENRFNESLMDNVLKLRYENGSFSTEEISKIPMIIDSGDLPDFDGYDIDKNGRFYSLTTKYKKFCRRLTDSELNELKTLFNLYLIYRGARLIDKDFILHSIDISPYSEEIRSLIKMTIFSMDRIKIQNRKMLDDLVEEKYQQFLQEKYYYILSDILNRDN